MDLQGTDRLKKVIGFELQDSNYQKSVFNNPYEGNSGMGGSEYAVYLAAYAYSKTFPNIHVILLHYNENCRYEGSFETRLIKDRECLSDIGKLDILVAIVSIRSDVWFETIFDNKIKLVLLAENFPSRDKLQQMKCFDCVKRLIFVGGMEYDRYIDDDIIEKSTIIENMHIPSIKEEIVNRQSEPIVTYMGALVPQKGFHILAKVWKKVLEQVPDAQLYVIGSGKLYDANAKLGKYGIAKSDYEEKFMKDLLGDNGNVLDSVHFCGVLGKEKVNILRRTRVGIPNPSGVTETFCNCAVEMQDMGISVVTIAGYSLFDVVDDGKSGFLFKKEEDFAKYIVRLLLDDELSRKMGNYAHDFVERFTVDKILPKWNQTFIEVIEDRKPKYLGTHGHFRFDRKYLNVVNRFLRFKLHLRFLRSRMGGK